MAARDPLDQVGMILEGTGIKPWPARGSRARQLPAPPRRRRSARTHGTDAAQVSIGEIVDATWFQPCPQRREGRGAGAGSHNQDLVRHEVMKKASSRENHGTRPTVRLFGPMNGSSPRQASRKIRRGRSVEGLDLLGRGQDELVVLLLDRAGHLDLDRRVLGGRADSQGLCELLRSTCSWPGSTWSSCRPWSR